MKFYMRFGENFLENKDMLDALEMKNFEFYENDPPTKEEVLISRSLMKAWLLAEELKGTISIEKDENRVKIIICKDL